MLSLYWPLRSHIKYYLQSFLGVSDLYFTKVPDSDIINRLHTILEAEHITCEDEVIRIIAQLG